MPTFVPDEEDQQQPQQQARSFVPDEEPQGSFEPDAASPPPDPNTVAGRVAAASPYDRFMAGAGRAGVEMGQGIYQLGASMGHAMGLVSDDKMKEIQSHIDESKKTDAPITGNTAGKIGHVVGEAAPLLAGQPESLLGAAAMGAGAGAIQPVETGGPSRLQNMTTGAIAAPVGLAAGKVAQGVIGGAGGVLNKWATDILKKEGVPMSVAQKTGNKGAQMIERSSEMVGSEPAEFKASQGAAYNKAVLKRIGADSDVADPGTLSDAHATMTGTMDDVASRTKIKFDDQLLNDLADVESDSLATLPTSDHGPIKQNIQDLLDNVDKDDYLNGDFYQKMQSRLGKLSKNPTTAPVAGDMLDAVNSAMHRSAAPGDAEALADAMTKYRAFKQILPAVDENGNISPAKLWNSINVKKNYNQSKLGKGNQDLVNLAKAGKAVLTDKLGNSGTAERALPYVTALELAGEGHIAQGAIKAAVGAGGLRAAGNAMRSQGVVGKYATSGIPGLNKVAPAAPAVATGMSVGEGETLKDQPIERASGGKVDHEALLARLMKRWKDAKKVTAEKTKPLLKTPDSAVAKALQVAQESIR